MKVLIVSAHSDLPEASLYLELKKKGFDLTIICAPTCPFKDHFTQKGIKTITFQGGGRISPRTILFLRGLIRRENPDYCHFTNSRLLSNGLIASIGLRVKITAYRGTSGHLSRLDPLAWLSYLNPRIHKIWCVSQAVQKYMLSIGVPIERTSVIYKGHELDWYRCESPPLLTEFGVPEDAFVVASVANARPVKGIDVLIKAFSQVDNDKSLHLLLIGKMEECEALLKSLDSDVRSRIHTTGFRHKPFELLYGAHVFVMPSIGREGLPKALLEAMAIGTAPIVTNVGGMPEVVRDGIDGLVVPPSSPNDIAEAILKLRSDSELRSNFAKNSKARVKESFSLDGTVEKVSELFRFA